MAEAEKIPLFPGGQDRGGLGNRRDDRVTQASAPELNSWREEIERGPVARYLRDLQAPMGLKPTLVCRVEVS